MVYELLSGDQPISRAKASLFFRLNEAGTVMAWSCLYAVKVSFLLLYRHIFQISKAFVRAWWITTVFVFATFWITIAGAVTDTLIDEDLCKTPSVIKRQRDFVIYSCVLNVASDLTTMALPMAMLKGLKLRTSAKIGLAGVFSLAFVTIAFDILRAVQTLTSGGHAGSTPLWTNLESAIAVVVSCLPSFVALRSSRKAEGSGRKPIAYQPQALMVSDSARLCMSGEGSLGGSPERSEIASRTSKTDHSETPSLGDIAP
ncbi:hypothetical protein ACLMJK_002565 [Lecanora helva]